jgi:phage terminase Nu1 subunit (DNA packaging protein)
MKTQTVSAQVVAEWLGISVRRARELSAAGIIVKAGRGYDLKSTIARYVAHLREEAAGRSGVAAAAVALKTANAKLAELRLQKEAGKVLDYEVAKQVISRFIIGLRNRFLQLPGKIAFEVPTLTATDKDRIDQLCRDEMDDASLGHGHGFNLDLDVPLDFVMRQMGDAGDGHADKS